MRSPASRRGARSGDGRRIDLNDIARGDGTLFVRDGVGRRGTWRGGTRRGRRRVATGSAGLEHDSTGRRARTGRHRRRPVPARRAVRPRRSRADRSQGGLEPEHADGRGAEPRGGRPAPVGRDRLARLGRTHRAPDTGGGRLHDRAERRRALPRRGGDGPRRRPRRRPRQGGDRPADHRDLRPADRRPCRPAPPARQLRVELPLLDRRLHRGLARAPHRGRR